MFRPETIDEFVAGWFTADRTQSRAEIAKIRKEYDL
jgi:hypothetical protein